MMKTFVLILAIALFVNGTGFALSPMVTPPPSPARDDYCRNHIHISVNGLEDEPEQHMLYCHENGIIADGMLMFVPLKEYVIWRPIPVVSREQFLSAVVSYDSYVESFSCNTVIYRKSGDDLEAVEDDKLSLEDLPEDTYLAVLSCSASHRGEAYRFDYLFWIQTPAEPTGTPELQLPGWVSTAADTQLYENPGETERVVRELVKGEAIFADYTDGEWVHCWYYVYDVVYIGYVRLSDLSLASGYHRFPVATLTPTPTIPPAATNRPE